MKIFWRIVVTVDVKGFSISRFIGFREFSREFVIVVLMRDNDFSSWVGLVCIIIEGLLWEIFYGSFILW